MSLKASVLQELKTCGTDQNRKVYKRHGAGEDLFGVSFKDQRKLAKKYKGDLDLAKALWQSKNTDARTLAILIAPPMEIEESTLNQWIKDITYYLLADLVAELISQTETAENMMQKLKDSEKEYEKAIAYSTLSCLLKNGHQFKIAELRKELNGIEASIHRAPNRAKHAMNMAVISIGIYCDELEGAVYQAAERIGKVEVDHGVTSCKTPSIKTYVKKARARKK